MSDTRQLLCIWVAFQCKLCFLAALPFPASTPSPGHPPSPPSSLGSHHILDLSTWTSDKHLKPVCSLQTYGFFSPSLHPTPNLPPFINGTATHRVAQATHFRGFLHSSVGKESACNAGDPVLIPGLGRSPGEGNGNPLQYSCLENPMDRGAWRATVHGVTRVGQDLATKPAPHTLQS